MMQTKLRYGSVLVAACLLFALVAGCGGGDDTETAADSPISKAQYIKRADAICTKTESRQEALIRKFGEQEKKQTPNSEAELVSFAGLPPVQQQAEEISDLPQPSSGAQEATAYVTALEEGLKAARKNPAALLEGENPFAKAEEVASKFGFKVCRGA
jgi:hypothetical protein